MRAERSGRSDHHESDAVRPLLLLELSRCQAIQTAVQADVIVILPRLFSQLSRLRQCAEPAFVEVFVTSSSIYPFRKTVLIRFTRHDIIAVSPHHGHKRRIPGFVKAWPALDFGHVPAANHTRAYSIS